MKKITSLLLMTTITFALVALATTRLRAQAQSGNSYTTFLPLLVRPLLQEYSLIYQVHGNISPGTLWLINPDGTNKVDLACENCRNPVWSPDGSTVAFAGVEMDNSGNEAQNIYVVDVNTKVVIRLTEDARQKDVCAWSPVKLP
jgi:dipeptidyl aminopeptidase/acylaminoacyl peptidase